MFSLSVIITNYNKAEYLEKCLNSVLEQSFNIKEIIIFDDCSKDNSKAILEYYEQINNKIKVIYSKENIGVSKARNEAIKISTGKYVTVLDADDFYFSKFKIEKEMQTIWRIWNEKGKKAASFSQTVLVDENGKPLYSLKIKPLGLCVRFGTTTRLYKYQVPRDYCFPRELLNEVGMYNEAYKLYEDWDFNLRLLSVVPFVFSENYGTAYRLLDDGLSSSNYREHFKMKRLIFKKNEKYLKYTVAEKMFFALFAHLAYAKGVLRKKQKVYNK